MSAAWSVKFPVYQIDFSAAAAGKRLASTKRRIRWRFGFPNKQALDEGRTGTDCRGEEHDIIVTWSITSGKRQVTMDTREVHYSSSRAGLLDFSWTTKGNHVIKVVCHAAAPLSPTPGFRQYDLFIDGQSFFTMPKVYELGIKGPVPGHARVTGHGYSDPTSPISMDSGYPRSVGGDYATTSREQEEADLRRAIQASLEESRRHLESKGHGGGTAVQTSQSSGEGDLLDFGSQAPSGPPGYSGNGSVSGMSYYSAPPTYSQTPPPYAVPPYQSPAPGPPVNPGALVPLHGPPGGYYQGPPPTAHLYASPPPVPPAPAPTPQTGYAPHPHAGQQMNYMNGPSPHNHDIFGLNSTPEVDPFAPKPPPPPPQQDLASMILGAYNGGPPTTPMAGGLQQNGGSPPQSNDGTPLQSMNAYALVLHKDEEGPVSELEKAMKNLVNIDHIDEPAEGEYKLTMIKKEEAKKMRNGKSAPLPPVGKDIVGSNATLSQIKEVPHGQRTLKQTADGVMKPPPPGAFSQNAAYAGALVVHGQGPPPLHQPMGFGLGARLPNGGFTHQQQAPPMGYQQQYR